MDAALDEAPSRPAAQMSEVIDFVHHEIDLLDRRAFEAWADLFTEDGYYWSPVGADQLNPLAHVSLFFDDKRTMITRIARLRHPRIHVQNPPSRTIHLVSNFRDLTGDSADRLRVRCNFVMLEFRVTKSQMLYGGTYDYVLTRAGGNGFRIQEKKATLVNSEDSFPSIAVWF